MCRLNFTHQILHCWIALAPKLEGDASRVNGTKDPSVRFNSFGRRSIRKGKRENGDLRFRRSFSRNRTARISLSTERSAVWRKLRLCAQPPKRLDELLN